MFCALVVLRPKTKHVLSKDLNETSNMFPAPVVYSPPVNPLKYKVRSLTLYDVGTYNAQFMRPMQLNSDHDGVNRLSGFIDANGPSALQGPALAGLAHSVVGISGTPVAQVGIPNGFDTKRLAFVMIVEESAILGTTVVHHIQGYTDHYGMSLQGSIDPQMRFYINNVASLSRNVGPTGQIETRLLSVFQLINGNLVRENMQMQGSTAFTIRPFDLAAGASLQNMNLGASFAGTDICDTRTEVTNGLRAVNRTQLPPASYLSDLLCAYRDSSQARHYGLDSEGIFGQMVSDLSAGNAMDNMFIEQLKTRSNDYQLGGSCFNLKILQEFVPNTPAPQYFRLSSQAVSKLTTAGSTAYLNGADLPTQVACQISSGVSSIMLNNFIGAISFVCTNAVVGGQLSIPSVASVSSFIEADTPYFIQRFCDQFLKLVANYVTHGNQLSFSASINADLNRDITIDLSIGGNPLERFAFPAFCDNLLSPLLVPSRAMYSDAVQSAESLLSALNFIPETPSAFSKSLTNFPTL